MPPIAFVVNVTGPPDAKSGAIGDIVMLVTESGAAGRAIGVVPDATASGPAEPAFRARTRMATAPGPTFHSGATLDFQLADTFQSRTSS